MFVSLWQEFKRQLGRWALLRDDERGTQTLSVNLSDKDIVPVVIKAMKHVHNHPDHEVFLYLPSEGRPYWGCRTCQFDEGEIIMTDPTS